MLGLIRSGSLALSAYWEYKKKSVTWKKALTQPCQCCDHGLLASNTIMICGRLFQDGRVEGRALTPCESTRITTNCWTVIDRKTLELTKKDTPHPKTKEKPQWDSRRGAMTIKSNPITAGWVTHKLENNYTTEVHPLEWRFWAAHQTSQPGGRATGGGITRESDFEG